MAPNWEDQTEGKAINISARCWEFPSCLTPQRLLEWPPQPKVQLRQTIQSEARIISNRKLTCHPHIRNIDMQRCRSRISSTVQQSYQEPCSEVARPVRRCLSACRTDPEPF